MRLGLFSISYAGLWGQHALELAQFFERAARMGFDGVMLAGKRPHLSPLDAAPERVAELKAALDCCGLRCDAVAAYTDFAGGPAAEVPYVEMQVAYVAALARVAAELGAGIVRVFTAYEAPGTEVGSLWPRVATALGECCDRAAEYGVTVAVQNHHDVAVHTDALLELLCDVGRANCKLAFDAWSPALRGEDLYAAARRAAPHTVMTTNADYVRWPRFHYQPALVNYLPAGADFVRAVPFGEGFIDYEAFFRGLIDGGFRGLANFEMCSPLRGGGGLENLDRCAEQYVRWMRERIFPLLSDETRP
jgi:sugar phosphate isomerase/epimerase